MNTSTYSSTTSIDLETLEGGAFDIIGCIDSVSGLSVGEDAKNVTLFDFSTTMGKVYKGNTSSTTTAIELIVRIVKECQSRCREGNGCFIL